MKNIIIVSKGQNAVAVGDNGMANVAKTAVGTFLSNLEVLKEVLRTIPVEPTETTYIHISDVIQGLVSGSAVEYVKTGKTGSGKDLSQEEIASFKEVYQLYAERILNVRFGLHKYIAKDNKELQALKKKAWDSLNTISVQTQQPIIKTEMVDPDKAIREALDAKMVQAIADGDVALYQQLKAMRDELKPAEMVTVQTTASVTTNNNTVEMPKFETTDADKAMENASAVEDGGQAFDENGQPIDFSANNNANETPAW